MGCKQASTVTLYGHRWCHLCADMQRALEALRTELDFELELIDIEGRAGLERRFGERVPVLVCGGREVCHYFLDESALRAALRAEGG